MEPILVGIAIALLAILITLGLRFRWWRVARGWLLYAAGRTPHPALISAVTVQLDPEAILASVRAGTAFALPMGRQSIDVLLEPATGLAEAAGLNELTDEGEISLEVDNPAAFGGTVVGEPDSDVRMSVTERGLTGYVRIGEVWHFVDSLNRFKPDSDPRSFVVYRREDLVFRFPFGHDAPKSDVEPIEGSEHTVNPHIGITIWSDEQYGDQADDGGFTWWQAQAALINMVNGIYQPQVGVQFVIRWFVLDRRSSTLTTSDASDLLDQFGDVVRSFHGDIRQLSERQRTNIEVAHLATGRNLKGKTLGVAWQPGVWGLSQQTLVFRLLGMTIPTVTAYGNMMVAAHELGHNFTGDHDEADKVCVTHFLWCWDYERTLMWPTYYSDNQDRFSSTNDTRVTNNAQSGRNVFFAHP